ncbi:MAG: hypothetical protein V3V08_11130 [Nannocystaceae bacterium]
MRSFEAESTGCEASRRSTDSGLHYHSSANSIYSTVCADIGNVGHRVRAPGCIGTWTVLQGYVDHRYLWSSGDGLVRSDVIWASNNRFHFGGFLNDW